MQVHTTLGRFPFGRRYIWTVEAGDTVLRASLRLYRSRSGARRAGLRALHRMETTCAI